MSQSSRLPSILTKPWNGGSGSTNGGTGSSLPSIPPVGEKSMTESLFRSNSMNNGSEGKTSKAVELVPPVMSAITLISAPLGVGQPVPFQ